MCDHINDPGGREAAMVVIERDDEGTPTVWCDPCIAPLVKALNDASQPTRWSCCGHGRRPATIGLWDDRQLLVLPSLESLHAIEHLWSGINGEPPVSPARLDAHIAKAKAEAWDEGYIERVTQTNPKSDPAARLLYVVDNLPEPGANPYEDQAASQ